MFRLSETDPGIERRRGTRGPAIYCNLSFVPTLDVDPRRASCGAFLADAEPSRRSTIGEEIQMWGQFWGQMLWGGNRAVPGLGFWGTLALGAALGIVGARLLRRARPRAVGALAIA